MSILKAPNGKPSNLSPKQWRLVRTPEFKAWFGDWENDIENSGKVSGLTKEPSVWYHSTKSDFISKKGENIFKKPPFFFALRKDISEDIVRIQHQNSKGRITTKAFFVRYKNPFDITKFNILSDKKLTKIIKENTLYNSEKEIRSFQIILGLPNYMKNTWVLTEIREVQEWIKSKGYDAFFVYEDGARNLAVFEPTQIKLADGTNTTFDGSNPDIRFELGGIYHGTNQKFDKFSTDYMGGGVPSTRLKNIINNKDMYKKGGKTESVAKIEKQPLFTNGMGVLAYAIDTQKVLLLRRKNSSLYDERDGNKWGVASQGVTPRNPPSTQVAQGLLLERAGIFCNYISPAYTYEYDRGITIATFENWVAFMYEEKKVNLKNSPYVDYIWISLDELSNIISSKGEGDKDTHPINYDDIQWGVLELFNNLDVKAFIKEHTKKFEESTKKDEDDIDPTLESERIRTKYQDFDFDLDPVEVKKTLIAPNGKESNLDEKQWKAVRSANFKNWFGDWEEAYRTGDYTNVSKVIDDNGEPLVVYRGHSIIEEELFGYIFSYNVNRFKFNREPNRFAFYFTKSKKIAELYSQLSPSGQKIGAQGIVKPYFLNIRSFCDITPKNPFYPTTEWWYNNILEKSGYKLRKLRDALQVKEKYDDYFYIVLLEIYWYVKNEGDNPEILQKMPNILKERYRVDKNKTKVTWEPFKQYVIEQFPKAQEMLDRIIKENEESEYGHNINLNILLKTIHQTKELNSTGTPFDMLADAEFEKDRSRYTFGYFINQNSSPQGTDILLKKMMIKKGYTGGIFLEHTYADEIGKPNEEVYFVFESNNIKLADGSNYTFKPDVMDTRYEDGGMFEIYPD